MKYFLHSEILLEFECVCLSPSQANVPPGNFYSTCVMKRVSKFNYRTLIPFTSV